MRQLIALCAFLATAMQMKADNYQYLVLQQTDGTQIKLVASGLAMVFQDGQLMANDGTSVSLASLKQMFFANEGTAIRTIDDLNADGPVQVYTLTGAHVATFSSILQARQQLRQQGVYVIKGNGKTQKIAVR